MRDGARVKHGGPARDDDQVGRAGRAKGGGFRVRGGVDEGERGAGYARGGKDGGEPCGLGGHHHGGVGFAVVGPGGGARLGVEVDDRGGSAGELAGEREVERQRGLARPALLRHHGDAQHAGMRAWWHSWGQGGLGVGRRTA